MWIYHHDLHIIMIYMYIYIYNIYIYITHIVFTDIQAGMILSYETKPVAYPRFTQK